VHNNHQGTPQVVTNSSKTVVWAADYQPFGKVNVTTNTVELYSRFPGQVSDSETGLYYNWNRFYDPSIGRYLESDRIGLRGGINTYTYVSANPISNVDPTGLKCVSYIDEYGNFVSKCDSGNPFDPNYCPSGDCAVYPPQTNTPNNSSLGNCMSQPNGNMWGQPRDQDNVCSLPNYPLPFGMVADLTVLPRCQRHDDCYAANGCTASSWVSSALGGSKACNQCNSGFFK